MNKKSLSEVTGLTDPLKDIMKASIALASSASALQTDRQQLAYYKSFAQVQLKYELVKTKLAHLMRRIQHFADDAADTDVSSAAASAKILKPEKCVQILDLYTDSVEIYLKKLADQTQKIRVQKNKKQTPNRVEEEVRPQIKYNLVQPSHRNTINQPLDYQAINTSIDVTPSLPIESTPFLEVNNQETFEQMYTNLRNTNEIAVDLQHSDKSYTGFTCLMQISTRSMDFVVDVFQVWSLMPRLNDIFNNPRILKVFHGSQSDIIWLHRDFDIRVTHLFDTYQAARILAHPRLSYAYLLKHYTGTDTDKKYQTSDWRVRPLPQEMLLYAKIDTHYLLEIYDKLKKDLFQKSAQEKTDFIQLLRTVFALSSDVANTWYRGENYKDSKSYQQTMWKHRKSMTESRLLLMEELFRYRDELARELDQNPDQFFSRKIIFQLLDKKSFVPAQVMKSFRKENPKLKQLVPRITQHLAKFTNDMISQSTKMEVQPPVEEVVKYRMQIEQERPIQIGGVSLEGEEGSQLRFHFQQYAVSLCQWPEKTFQMDLALKSRQTMRPRLNFECPMEYELSQFQIRLQSPSHLQLVQEVEQPVVQEEQQDASEGEEAGQVDPGVLYFPKIKGVYEDYRKPVSTFKQDQPVGRFEAQKPSNKKRKQQNFQERIKKSGQTNMYSYLDD